MYSTLYTKIQSASVLALLIVITVSGTVRAQNTYRTANQTSTLAGGTSISITSGDLPIRALQPS